MGANEVAEVRIVESKVSVHTGNNYCTLPLHNIHTIFFIRNENCFLSHILYMAEKSTSE